MSTDITYRDLSGRVSLSPGTVRKLQAEEGRLAAQTVLAQETISAKGYVVRAFVEERKRIVRALRESIEEDPINLGVLDVLQAFDQDAAAIVRRISR